MAAGLIERDRACVWHPYTQALTQPAPLAVTRGEGVYLFTEDGQRVLDGISSWWVNIHGHAHPRLNAALAEQASKIEHVLFAGCTHDPAVTLAERLLEVLPAGLARIFYSDNGSTAVEVALKMAIQYWRNRGEPNRRLFVTLRGAYHGDTVGAMSASEDSIFTAAFKPLLFDVERADAPYCYRCPLGLDRSSCGIDCLDSLRGVLERHRGDVAGVLVEPMLQGAGGMIVWPAEFLAGVRRLCDASNTLMIADEVLTGFGRTGRMFACEHAGVTPDLMCLSKALTAGYLPLGVTAVTSAIYDAFSSTDRAKTFFHGHSFTANPLACAVAIASLDLLRETGALARVTCLEALLRAGLDPLRACAPVGDVRVLGGVGVIELVADKGTKEGGGYLDGIGPRIAAACLSRGLLIRPLGNIVYFMPPYVITDAEAAWAIDQIGDVIAQSG
jgi:adenosylmethionine-8-amino-7-oxononanoate aminotransferase